MKRDDVAIIGMAGRYPGCEDPDQLFQNLMLGKELAVDEPMSTSGRIRRHFNLQGIDQFDHSFFGYTPFESQVMDPQHRVLLTEAYRAVENSGYEQFPQHARVGVFASTSLSTYLINNLLCSDHFDPEDLNYKILLGNDKDTLATRIAYKLNLKGPAVTVQSACSSSLVAIHFACQSILSGECDIAIVGAVSITVPQNIGYKYKEGMILAQDGICRPFDRQATGTIKGNGCSVLVLRRSADAVRAGDMIRAIIKGTAVNNDGNEKIGFTAPGIAGQCDVIEEAQSFAGITPSDVDYIETHGTGTKLGDQIELTSLARCIPESGRKIPLGAIKANLGHLDAAAGATSVIKLAMMLQKGQVPPIANLRSEHDGVPEAAKRFSFPKEPFHANLKTAAVSSFGIGGTNAHAILERYDIAEQDNRVGLPYFLVPLSVNERKDWPQYRDTLTAALDAGASILDLSAVLAARRSRRSIAFCIVATDSADLKRQLDALQEPPRGQLNAIRKPAPEDWDLAMSELHAYATAARWPFTDAFAGSQTCLARLGVSPDRIVAYHHDTDAESASASSALERILRWLSCIYSEEDIDLSQFYFGTGWRAIPLPNYPLKSTSHWIEPAAGRIEQQPAEPASKPATRDTVERILDIWEEFIGGERPAADMCFVDSGADSFAAIEVIDKINEVFGSDIKVDAGVAELTALDIAAMVGRDDEQAAEDQGSTSPWITQSRLGSFNAKTLFLVHAAGGSTYNYSQLGRQLRSDISVCSIDLPELFRGYETLPELASTYMQAILDRSPSGPVLLGGYSFGGNVAHEIACQMQSRGIDVEAVVMFDAHPPEVYETNGETEFDYVGAFPALMACYFAPTRLAQVEGKTPGTLSEAIAIARSAELLDTRLTDEEIETFFERWVFSHSLLKSHRPAAVANTSLVMFEAQEPEPHSLFERLKMRRVRKDAWRAHFTRSETFIPVPGDHFTMFSDKQHLKELARIFDDAFECSDWAKHHALLGEAAE